MPETEMPTSYERKSIFEVKKSILAWKTVFFILFPQKCTQSDPWQNKSILRHFAQNHKYFQLEKSTKYCKKGTVGISAEKMCFSMH